MTVEFSHHDIVMLLRAYERLDDPEVFDPETDPLILTALDKLIARCEKAMGAAA